MKPYMARPDAIEAAIADLQRVVALESVSSPNTGMTTSVVVSPAAASAVAVAEGGSVRISEGGSVRITPGTAELRTDRLLPEGAPIWRWALLAFENIGHALRIPELLKAIRALGGPPVDRET